MVVGAGAYLASLFIIREVSRSRESSRGVWLTWIRMLCTLKKQANIKLQVFVSQQGYLITSLFVEIFFVFTIIKCSNTNGWTTLTLCMVPCPSYPGELTWTPGGMCYVICMVAYPSYPDKLTWTGGGMWSAWCHALCTQVNLPEHQEKWGMVSVWCHAPHSMRNVVGYLYSAVPLLPW